MINYNNKRFKALHNSKNGEVDQQMIFNYVQNSSIVTCTYHGLQIKTGHLIALVKDDGSLDMRYHQINLKGEIMTGICHSTPEFLKDGRIRLHEKWQWTSGDLSHGESVLEEIMP